MARTGDLGRTIEEIKARFDDLGVLFVTKSPGFEARVSDWFADYPHSVATGLGPARETFDATVGVVCFTDDVPEDGVEAFRRDVLKTRPSTQFIALTTGDPDADRLEVFDTVLAGPVEQSTLEDAIQERLTYAMYTTLLRTYYSLNAQSIARDQGDTEDAASESGESGESGDGDSSALEDRLAVLRRHLLGFQAVLSIDDVHGIATNLEARRRHLDLPGTRSGDAASSKYYPDSCPECGLDWGENADTNLGKGYEDLGTGVRKCQRCEETIHDLHDNNQWVT